MMRNRAFDLVVLMALIAGAALWIYRPIPDFSLHPGEPIIKATTAQLFVAIRRRDIPLVQQCLGLDPSLLQKANEYGTLPIHAAVATGDQNLTWEILKAGAGINDRDASQLTPLHWAAKKGDVGMVGFLLEKGADPRAATADGSTPTSTANQYREGHWQEVVRVLGLPHMKQSRAQ